jgi:hypothetical protein
VTRTGLLAKLLFLTWQIFVKYYSNYFLIFQCMLHNTLHNLNRAFVKSIHVNVESRFPPGTHDSTIFIYLKPKHIFRSKEEAKVQWLRNTKTSNTDNRNNEERKTSSHRRMKGQKNLIGNINEFGIKGKNQNIR